MSDVAETVGLLRERLAGLLEGNDPVTPLPNGDVMARVAREGLFAAAVILKEDLGFTTLMNHLGVDYGDRMAVVYNLFAPRDARKVALKVLLERASASVPTLVPVFRGIAWFERETYDLLGIAFDGHANLKRLLLPEDWVGHPLRKDYVYPESYGGVEMRRADPFAASVPPGVLPRG